MRRALLALAVGCSQDRPIATCADDLGGIYVVEGAPAQRWHVIEPKPGALEAYPLFDDAPDSAIEVAPRVIDIERGDPPRGKVRRRYLQGPNACTATAPVTLTRCTGRTLELVLGDPTPPLAFTPCTLGSPAPSRRERWLREPR